MFPAISLLFFKMYCREHFNYLSPYFFGEYIPKFESCIIIVYENNFNNKNKNSN